MLLSPLQHTLIENLNKLSESYKCVLIWPKNIVQMWNLTKKRKRKDKKKRKKFQKRKRKGKKEKKETDQISNINKNKKQEK